MKNILFVGAFNINNNAGITGGQLFACNSIVSSKLNKDFNFVKIDSTTASVPIPSVFKRGFKAGIRIIKFVYFILFKKIDSVLIFSADSLSFIEKGLMVLLARMFLLKVIFAPRSGMSINDYNDSLFMRFYMKIIIKSATYVLCQGKFWINFYNKMDLNNSSKFILMHNWIDINSYKNNSYQIRERKFKIIYIGWLEEFKGVLDLLDALVLLKKNNRHFICEIYGGGSLEDKIQKFIVRNNLKEYVILKGWANPKTKIKAYETSDIFILPSHFEGFPNSLLEAMSAEMPVISSNVGAVLDIVNDGKDGLIFESKNVIQLLNKIELLINNPIKRFEIAKNARKKIVENFSIDQAISKFKKIL